MIKVLFILLLLGTPTILLCDSKGVDDLKDMQIACTIINGKIKDGPKCVKIQQKLIEARCKKGDPNACKALEEAKNNKNK